MTITDYDKTTIAILKQIIKYIEAGKLVGVKYEQNVEWSLSEGMPPSSRPTGIATISITYNEGELND